MKQLFYLYPAIPLIIRRAMLILILGASFSGCQSADEDRFDKAFVHSVYIWLKDPDNQQDRDAFEKSLDKFLRNSEFALTKYVGTPPVAIRPVVDDSFTYNLVVTFPSAEAQAGYQKEEAHLIFLKEASSLWKKVVVYDSQSIR